MPEGRADLGSCRLCNPGEIYLNPPNQNFMLPAWGWVWNFNLRLSAWSKGERESKEKKKKAYDEFHTFPWTKQHAVLFSGRLNESLCGQFEAGGLSWEMAEL